MPGWNSFSYAFGPLMALLLIGLFAVILRWAFRRGSSVVAAPARSGPAHQYGLLTAVASPGSYAEGEMLRRRLEESGIRATLATTLEGPRVMVWPEDVTRARTILTTGR